LCGQEAPDWTAWDVNLDNVPHNLHDDLEAGYTVVIEFFTTHCQFCWDIFQGNALKNQYALHGPDGDNTWRVYMIEGDFNTGMAELMGNGNSVGNWIQNNDIPIIDDNSIQFLYPSNPYPYRFLICPEDKSFMPVSLADLINLDGLAAQNCPTWTGPPVGGGGGGGNDPGTTLQAEVAFQGYQVPGEMSTTLVDNGLLPMSQPFDTAPFNYDGDETISSIPNNTVDWVLVELRDATDESVTVDQKAALVDKDGNIIGTDGSMGVSFDAADGDYYVVIHHAGHVSVMSSSTVTLPNSSAYDFKSSNNAVMGSNQMKLSNGAFVMRAGDYDNNGTVNFSDFVRWLQNNNDLNTYADYDGDGNTTINFTDFILWLSNNNHLRYSGI